MPDSEELEEAGGDITLRVGRGSIIKMEPRQMLQRKTRERKTAHQVAGRNGAGAERLPKRLLLTTVAKGRCRKILCWRTILLIAFM